MIPRRRYNIEAGFFNDALTGRLAPSRMRAFVPRFEAALAASLGGRHSVQATGSGRKALATLLDTLGIPKGSTIMIPAYTLGDIGPFLGRLGYRWITCDVDPQSGDVACWLADSRRRSAIAKQSNRFTLSSRTGSTLRRLTGTSPAPFYQLPEAGQQLRRLWFSRPQNAAAEVSAVSTNRSSPAACRICSRAG